MSLLVEFGPISEPRRMKELCSCMPVTFFLGEGSKSSGFLTRIDYLQVIFLLAFETHKCRMRIIRCHVISTPIHQNFMQPGWKTHWILDWHERKTIIYICVFQDVSGWDVAKSLGVGKLEKSVCAAQNPAGVLMDFSHAKIYYEILKYNKKIQTDVENCHEHLRDTHHLFAVNAGLRSCQDTTAEPFRGIAGKPSTIRKSLICRICRRFAVCPTCWGEIGQGSKLYSKDKDVFRRSLDHQTPDLVFFCER